MHTPFEQLREIKIAIDHCKKYLEYNDLEHERRERLKRILKGYEHRRRLILQNKFQ